MKWFKHFSKAHRDTKIKKLINEFGSEGYAVYFYCLELIADSLEMDNITFEIEDDAQLVGQYLHLDTLRVEKIMLKCVELDLFEIAETGSITCFKMAKFLDERYTRNPELIKMIKNERIQEVKQLMSEDKSRQVETSFARLDETRLEENRQDKKQDIYTSIFDFWNSLKLKHHKKITEKIKNKIIKALKEYSEDEIKQAIIRYDKIVNNEKYFFTYKWSLCDFLQRGIEKFDDDICYTNFLKDKNSFKKNSTTVNSEMEKYREEMNKRSTTYEEACKQKPEEEKDV